MESLHVAADHDAALMTGSNISHLTWLLIVVMICKPLSNLIQLVCLLAMLENSWFEQWEVRLALFLQSNKEHKVPLTLEFHVIHILALRVTTIF